MISSIRCCLSAHGLPLLIMVVNALLVMAPCLPNMGTQLAGDTQKHAIDSAWIYYLTAHALTDLPLSVFSRMFDYPYGWDITHFVDLGNATIFAPITALFGAIFSHNLALIMMLFLTGVSAYALAMKILGNRVAAVAAGLLYVDTGAVFFAIHWGEDDVATSWLLPAYLAVLLWSLDRCPAGEGANTDTARPTQALSLSSGAAAGALLVLTGWINSYFLLFNSMVTPLAWLAVARRDRRRRPPLGFWVRYLAAFAVVFAVGYGPRALIGKRPWAPRVWKVEQARSVSDLFRPGKKTYYAGDLDLPGLFDPLSNSRARAEGKEVPSEGTLYLGLLLLPLAAVGLFKVRPKFRWTLVAVGAMGFFLALGTNVRWREGPLLIGGQYVLPGPEGLLNALVPFVSSIKHPYRFIFLLYMSISVLGGAGIFYLASRMARRHRVLIVAALTTLCLGERLLAGPGIVPIRPTMVPMPRIFSSIPAVPGRPAILHLPWGPTSDVHELELNRFHRYAQLAVHDRPLFVRANGTWLRKQVSRVQMDHELAALSGKGVGVILVMRDILRCTRSTNRVKHPWEREYLRRWFHEAAANPARDNLRKVLSPWYSDADVEVYLVPPHKPTNKETVP